MNEFEKARLEQVLEAVLPEQDAGLVAEKLLELGVRVPVLCEQCRSWSPHNPGSVMGTCFCRGFSRGTTQRKDGYCSRGEDKRSVRTKN